MNARVSVLVPSYQDHHLLDRSLRRMLDGSGCELEVVVMNNDSMQAGRVNDVVHTLADPRIRVLELEHRAGFVKAINAGVEATAGEFVFFANSDLFIAPGYIDELIRFFKRRPRAGCAAGKILRYDLAADHETDIIDSTGHVIGHNRRVADRGENQRDIGQYEREEEVFGVSGAALLARREALESAKLLGEYLDESFDMYKEDIDLCWRLRLLGWECWYVPRAVAYHARTSHGLARRSYLSGIRAFHENEMRKSRRVRMNSMRNQWFVLLKNDDLPNFARDAHHILGREALVIAYNLASAPRDTMSALSQFLRSIPRTRAKRSEVKSRRQISPSQIRSWFAPGSHPS